MGQLPSGATLRGSWSTEDQKHCLRRSFIHARRSAGEGSLVSGQALGVSSGPVRTRTSWSAVLDPDAEGQPPRKGGEQGKESLVQCVQVNSASQHCCLLPPSTDLVGSLVTLST